MTRIDAAVDGGREYDPTALLEPDEGIAPGRIVGRQARARNGDEPTTIEETRQSRRKMAIRCVRHTTLDMRGHGEGWIHQHDAGAHRVVQMIVDVGRVVPRDRDIGKQQREQIGAGIRQFVQDEVRACEFGKDREQAGSRRRFQNQIGCVDRSRGSSGKSKCNRRRELL